MIKVENLHRHFGGFHAVDGASLEIREGSITGLVGPNWRWQNHFVQRDRGRFAAHLWPGYYGGGRDHRHVSA
jgi:ABC-type uncharacterized transport system ATPase subunit